MEPTGTTTETTTAPGGVRQAEEGIIKLRASDFQSHEVPHYFLTSGRKWLVCIDGSTECKLGLFHALDLMNPAEDSLLLVHAAKKARSLRLPHWRSSTAEEPQPAGARGAPVAGPPPEQEPEPDSIKRGKGYLAHAGDLVRRWSEEVKWQSRLITAKDPREAICDLATDEKVDYIVMGSRGQNPIKQIFMGAVSSYVSSHAPCPVIVIRESEEERREKKAASLEEKKAQKKTTEKKKEKKKISKRDQKKAEGLDQQPQMMPQPQQPIVGEEMKRGEPSIAPPVTSREGPIMPEITIPVMEK